MMPNRCPPGEHPRSQHHHTHPTRNASGLILLLRALGWSGSDAARKLGISHPTLIMLRDGTVRPGIRVIDTVMDSLRAHGLHPDMDILFPRDDQPATEEGHGPLATAAG